MQVGTWGLPVITGGGCQLCPMPRVQCLTLIPQDNMHQAGKAWSFLLDTWHLRSPGIPVQFSLRWPVSRVEVILETSLQGRVGEPLLQRPGCHSFRR